MKIVIQEIAEAPVTLVVTGSFEDGVRLAEKTFVGFKLQATGDGISPISVVKTADGNFRVWAE